MCYELIDKVFADDTSVRLGEPSTPGEASTRPSVARSAILHITALMAQLSDGTEI